MKNYLDNIFAGPRIRSPLKLCTVRGRFLCTDVLMLLCDFVGDERRRFAVNFHDASRTRMFYFRFPATECSKF